jgi:hypothetical protein
MQSAMYAGPMQASCESCLMPFAKDPENVNQIGTAVCASRTASSATKEMI